MESGSYGSPQLKRFEHQYFQLETSLDYPDAKWLRMAAVQESLYHGLFVECADRPLPPIRYQLKVLKELLKRVEASIQDWDDHVSPHPGNIHIDLPKLRIRRPALKS